MCKIYVGSTANRAMHTFQDRTFDVGVSTHLTESSAELRRTTVWWGHNIIC